MKKSNLIQVWPFPMERCKPKEFPLYTLKTLERHGCHPFGEMTALFVHQ